MLHLLRGLALLALLSGVLLGSAGRWDLPFAWAYVGLNAALVFGTAFTVDPDLLQERWHPRPGGRDLLPWLLIGVPAYVAQLVVAGLDVGRFHWSQVAAWVQVAGLAVAAAAWVLVWWAMVVNPFFAATIRLQSERGHRLITAGPYRWVRHPGYAGGILGFLVSPLALGSWWALVPSVPLVLLVVRRMTLEERFLPKALPGYRDYAGRVRYRLLPGLW